jgi:hypothetical protein
VKCHTDLPIALIPMIDISDTGKYLTPILLNPAKYNGKNFTCATDFYTPLQLIEGWSQVTGVKVTYEQIGPGEKQGALTDEMHEQLKKSLGLINVWGYFGEKGRDDLDWTLKQMDEKPNTWEEFVRMNRPWFGEE